MAFKQMNDVKQRMPQWISNGLSSKEDINLIEEIGKHIADAREGKRGGYFSGRNAVSTSQIRIAYGEITRLKMKFDKNSMMLLRPKLAYAAARNSGESYQTLKDVISLGIDLVAEKQDEKDSKKAFNNLSSVFEAILAYHKAYGGK